MKHIQEILVFGLHIFFNPTSGLISNSKNDVLLDGEIDIDEEINNYQPSSINICINISDACNLNCKYCFNSAKKGTYIKSSEAINFIDYIILSKYSNCKKYYVDLSGKGEPLLNKETIFIINEHCKNLSKQIKKNIVVQFVCNGTLLTKELSSKLKKEEILFGISIDGPKKNHNMYRKTTSNKSTYDLIMKNVAKIDNKDYLGVAVTINQYTFPLYKTIKKLRKYFPTISIKPVRGPNSFTTESIENWCKEYSILTKRLYKQVLTFEFDLLFSLLNGDDYFGKFIKRIFLNNLTLSRCDTEISRFTLDTDGTIKGCPVSNKKIDIKSHNEKISMKQQIQKTLNLCGNCPYLLFCGGECEIEAKNNNGLNKNLCQFKKHLINLSMYLKIKLESENKEQFYIIYEKCKEIINRV